MRESRPWRRGVNPRRRRPDFPARAFSLSAASRSGISSAFFLLHANLFPDAPLQALPRRRRLAPSGAQAETPPPSTTGAVSVLAVHSTQRPCSHWKVSLAGAYHRLGRRQPQWEVGAEEQEGGSQLATAAAGSRPRRRSPSWSSWAATSLPGDGLPRADQ
jgi:hypothetical protein